MLLTFDCSRVAEARLPVIRVQAGDDPSVTCPRKPRTRTGWQWHNAAAMIGREISDTGPTFKTLTINTQLVGSLALHTVIAKRICASNVSVARWFWWFGSSGYNDTKINDHNDLGKNVRFENVCLESIGAVIPQEIWTSADVEHRLEPVYSRLKFPEGRLELMSGIGERRIWPAGTLPSGPSIRSGNLGDRRGANRSQTNRMSDSRQCLPRLFRACHGVQGSSRALVVE